MAKYKVLSTYPPPELRERIEAEAAGEKRLLAPMALILMEEALDARARKHIADGIEKGQANG